MGRLPQMQMVLNLPSQGGSDTVEGSGGAFMRNLVELFSHPLLNGLECSVWMEKFISALVWVLSVQHHFDRLIMGLGDFEHQVFYDNNCPTMSPEETWTLIMSSTTPPVHWLIHCFGVLLGAPPRAPSRLA